MDQKTDNDNTGKGGNATGGDSKSPTHGQASTFRPDDDRTVDNNAYKAEFPVEHIRRT